jgi:hypothetical protein
VEAREAPHGALAVDQERHYSGIAILGGVGDEREALRHLYEDDLVADAAVEDLPRS